MQLSQDLLLYLALFSSIMAIIFSIQTHQSTNFVVLSESLQIGVFFKNVSSIGLSSWELCGVKQDIVDTILEKGIGSLIRSLDLPPFNKTSPSVYPTVATSKVFDEPQRNLYSILSPTDGASPVADESELDDNLASADFPYRDDDEVLLKLPSEYWSCQIIEFPSNKIDDEKWVIPRVFLVVGTILGVTGVGFLVLLIVLRGRQNKHHVKQSQTHCNCNKNNQLINGIKQIESFGPSHDTTITGYRPISSLFLLSYLFQCVTFIIFDSDICKTHVCTASTGAYSLVAACVLWVVSGVLVLLMLRKCWKNEEHTRKVAKLSTIQGLDTCEPFTSTLAIADRDVVSTSLPSEQIQASSPSRSLNDTFDADRGGTSCFHL